MHLNAQRKNIYLFALFTAWTSIPTRTDLSVQVRIFFKNPFLYGLFQKYGFLSFCTDFFFKKRPFLYVLLINSALLQIV